MQKEKEKNPIYMAAQGRIKTPRKKQKPSPITYTNEKNKHWKHQVKNKSLSERKKMKKRF